MNLACINAKFVKDAADGRSEFIADFVIDGILILASIPVYIDGPTGVSSAVLPLGLGFSSRYTQQAFSSLAAQAVTDWYRNQSNAEKVTKLLTDIDGKISGIAEVRDLLVNHSGGGVN